MASEQDLSVVEAAELILEECRTVLPGVQALFGFQLIAVFHPGFEQKLTATEQHLHLLAITLVVVAAALLMTPAAYHRHKGSRRLSWDFVTISTRLVLFSMLPLALGMCLDLYLIARIVLGDGWGAPALGALMLAGVLGLWFVMPRLQSAKR